MAGNSSGTSVVAALVLGTAVVVGSLVLKGSLDGQTAALEGVRTALTALDESVRQGGVARQQARAEPRRGPDPAARHTVSVDGSPVLGNENAKVTLVEFMDFQCPFCSRVRPTLDQIRTTYGDQVRIVSKHLPLRIHPQAPGAAAAAEAAHRQGRYWEMRDRLFDAQRELSDEKYREIAQQLGLDLARFDQDRASPEVKQRVERDEQEAERLGVSGTPAFFINGRFLSGAQPFDAFKRMIDEELAKG
jgi:protein-disulfide isomerase